MTQKQRQPMLAPHLEDGISVPLSEPNTLVTLSDQAVQVRRARLTLAALSVAVAAADDFGGTKLLDLPDRNILLLGCEADLTLVKAGTTNGLVAATDLNVGIGTAVASNITLSSTMQNVIDVAAVTTDALSVAYEAHSNDNSTTVLPLPIADGASSALYLNVAVAAGITADDTLTASGTIDLWYIDLGNLSS